MNEPMYLDLRSRTTKLRISPLWTNTFWAKLARMIHGARKIEVFRGAGCGEVLISRALYQRRIEAGLQAD
jgi:hypothetical protein